MRHSYFGRHLRRDTNATKNLYRSLMSSVIARGKIETTAVKAKAVRGDLEHLILLSKIDNQNNRKNVAKILGGNQQLDRLFREVGPAFSEVNSGFTRMLKLGPRFSDTAEMAVLELTRLPMALESRITNKVSSITEGTEETTTTAKKTKKVKKTTKSKTKNP